MRFVFFSVSCFIIVSYYHRERPLYSVVLRLAPPPHPTRPLTRPRGALRIPSPALHALFTCLYRIYILFLLLLLLSNEMYVLVYSNNGSENAELENTRRGRTRALVPIEIKTGQIYRLSLDLE